MKIMRFPAILSLMLVLAACSTNTVDMSYNAEGVKANGQHVIAVGQVTDARGDSDLHYLGAIRGGFGNPLKSLNTKEPVSEVVKTAIEDGLKARGLFASKPAYTLSAKMPEFNCSQYARREAHIVLDVTVISTASQQPVFSKQVKVDKVNGSVVTFDSGVFASVDDLRALANEVLQEAVDKLLNDSQFLQAIHAS